MKLTQLEKVHCFKVNDLKLTHVEFFQFFTFIVVANVSEFFGMAHVANIEQILCHFDLLF